MITSVATWLEEMKRDLGTFDYLKPIAEMVKGNALDALDYFCQVYRQRRFILPDYRAH